MAPTPASIPVGIAAAAALMLLAPHHAAASTEASGARAGDTALAALAVPPVPPRAAEAPRWGAAYAAEGIGFRLSAGFASRDEARRAAGARCRSGSTAAACRPLGEFAGRCGAVARAVDRSMLHAAARPITPASVGTPVLGAGATEEEASRAALQTCAAQPGASTARLCLVVAVGCGPR